METSKEIRERAALSMTVAFLHVFFLKNGTLEKVDSCTSSFRPLSGQGRRPNTVMYQLSRVNLTT